MCVPKGKYLCMSVFVLYDFFFKKKDTWVVGLLMKLRLHYTFI